MAITADDLMNEYTGGGAKGGAVTEDDLVSEWAGQPKEAPGEPQRTMLTPVKEAGAALASAGQALAGGKVSIPGYGDVPAADDTETLGQSIMRAPARAGAAAMRALPALDLPGNMVEEAGSEAGHPYLGKAAGIATNLLLPGAIARKAGVGRELAAELSKTAEAGTLAERAGATAQTAIQRTKNVLYSAARAHYDEAANLAEEAGTRVELSHMSGATKEAEKMLEEFGDRLPKGAKDIVEEIATHPGNVSYAQWDSLRGRIQDMALRPEQYATSERFVPKAMTQLDRLVKDGLRKSVEGTEAGKALDLADSGWKEASDFNRLVGKSTRADRTGTQVMSALTDPKKLRTAIEKMTPTEQDAFGTLRRAAAVQEKAKTVLGFGKSGMTAVGLEGGAWVLAGMPHSAALAAPVALAAAAANPRIALLIAKGIKTPAATAAATKITTELAKLLEAE